MREPQNQIKSGQMQFLLTYLFVSPSNQNNQKQRGKYTTSVEIEKRAVKS